MASGFFNQKDRNSLSQPYFQTEIAIILGKKLAAMGWELREYNRSIWLVNINVKGDTCE